MSTIIRNKDTGYRRVVGSPNELTDAGPGLFHEQELIRFMPPEPDGRGEYNLINWWIKKLDREERLEDQFNISYRFQRDFHRKLEAGTGIPCSTNPVHKHSGNHGQFHKWRDTEDDVSTDLEGACAWDDIAIPSAYCDGIWNIFLYRFLHDPDFEAEVLHGDWD